MENLCNKEVYLSGKNSMGCKLEHSVGQDVMSMLSEAIPKLIKASKASFEIPQAENIKSITFILNYI